MSGWVAGHWFELTSLGYEVCVEHAGQKGCGMRWRHAASATPEDVGQRGFSHEGILTPNEYSEVDKKRKAEVDRTWRAVLDVGQPGIEPGSTDVFDGDGLASTHEQDLHEYLYS